MNNITFMDFCSGIGAGRLGLEKNGLSCVAFSEIDKHAEITYRKLFGNHEVNYGDLMAINTSHLPDFDMLIAGFPCQTFSVIGQRQGLNDERGQIIYGLIKIMLAKNTKYFILENVKGLINHDAGNSLKVILSELDKAGYKVYYKVLNSIDYGVPQMRERIYFVGVRKDIISKHFNYNFPTKIEQPSVKNYLIDNNEDIDLHQNKQIYATFIKYLNNKYNFNKYTIDELLKQEMAIIDTRQSDLRLYINRVPTLRAGRHGILYIKNGKFKKISGYESLLLQGFPIELSEKISKEVAEVHILKQAGNAMTVTTIEAIAKELFATLDRHA